MNILPVILSGGVGSRLWPLSREAHPKPLIKLFDGESMLQKTYKRAHEVSTSDEILTVTNRELFFSTQDDFEETCVSLKNNTFLLEPVGRNSTAAIAVAAQYALTQHGPDCIILAMPADHLIDNISAFKQALSQGKKLASQGMLVTFGIKPSLPKTGYGYILANGNKVQKFVEKPNKKTAEQYIKNGSYFWNSGIFCMRASTFLEELSLFEADIAEQASKSIINAKRSSGENWKQFQIQRRDFEKIKSISVDYAVFEKSQKVAIVPCDIGWSDIGSWSELGALYQNDEHNNNIFGNVICKETQDCVIHADNRLVATLDVKDLIIADTSDALLVAHKDRTQDVSTIVDTLKSRNDNTFKEFPTMHRPWGTYTILQVYAGFKIKRIEVKPGARLSLQSHKHRSEHWVVVRGNALVTNGDKMIKLKPSQSTHIPVGHKHRLENTGTEKLIVIEVQCGEYLSEEDIVRYEDAYGR